MATKRILPDKDFGNIIIRSRKNVKRLILRLEDGEITITVPPYTAINTIKDALTEVRPKLLEEFPKHPKKQLSLDYSVESPYFHLTIGTWKGSCFRLHHKDGKYTVECPDNTDFEDKRVQTIIRQGIVSAMKYQAKKILPGIVAEYAARYEKEVKTVKITGAKNRWGSCSSIGTICLSCYLITLPPHLVDYVILHELAHTVEMNHSDKFWELLNSMTDGNARKLRAELHTFRTGV